MFIYDTKMELCTLKLMTVNSSTFANSACFYIQQDKWFPGHAAIESVKSPGHFFRHQGLQLKTPPL